MGRFPSLVGRFLTLMGRFPEFLDGPFSLLKIAWKAAHSEKAHQDSSAEGGLFWSGVVFKSFNWWVSWFPWFSWFLEILEFPTVPEGHKHRVTTPRKTSQNPADPRRETPQSHLRGKFPRRTSLRVVPLGVGWWPSRTLKEFMVFLKGLFSIFHLVILVVSMVLMVSSCQGKVKF